jgi:LacI family transcriptional regulator
MTHRNTIHDIAATAGVSKSTVSRVLNGSLRVSPETRARVLDAVERSSYQVNHAARSLRTTRSAMVGLLVPQINNEVFGAVAEQLYQGLNEQDVALAITSSGWTAEGDLRALDTLESRGVDAIVAALAEDRSPHTAQRLRALPCPLVLLDREVRGVACDTILTDPRPGMDQALDHLIGLGHHAIGVIAMTENTRPGREMVAAYRAGIERLGLRSSPALIVTTNYADPSAGRAGAEQLLGAGATAIITMGSMTLVAGLFDHLDEAGLRVPEDLSLVLYTDSPLAAVKRPRFTVIARPIPEVGQLATRFVLARMGGDSKAPPRVAVVRTHLVIRESTMSPPAGGRPA